MVTVGTRQSVVLQSFIGPPCRVFTSPFPILFAYAPLAWRALSCLCWRKGGALTSLAVHVHRPGPAQEALPTCVPCALDLWFLNAELSLVSVYSVTLPGQTWMNADLP